MNVAHLRSCLKGVSGKTPVVIGRFKGTDLESEKVSPVDMIEVCRKGRKVVEVRVVGEHIL